MWLKQKWYSFQCEKDVQNPETLLDGIMLKVNGNLTEVKLVDLFNKISENSIEFKEDKKILEVKGWSVLENVEPKTGVILIGDKQIVLSFESEQLGQITLLKLSNPIVIFDDRDIDDSKYKDFEEKIIELSILKEDSNSGLGTGSPHSNPNPTAVFNKNYENNKVRLINNGYQEFSYGQFKILKKDDVILLFEIVDDVAVNKYSEKTKVMDNFYQFVDSMNDRKLNVKFIDGAVEVEIIGAEAA